jgi:hypothetical protein
MDTDVLNSIPDCKAIKQDGSTKPCCYWREYIGECIKPNNVDCPQGVRKPQQEVAETCYNSLS